ncbi:MAG TPA: hypothetical protein VGD07_05085, partial [Methylomirabilota bacterium]
VDVRRGLYVDRQSVVREFAGQADFDLTAAHATLDRIDLLYLSGVTLSKLDGTPSGSPTAPVIPIAVLPLAFVYVRATSTSFNETDTGGTVSYLYRDLRGLINQRPTPTTRINVELGPTSDSTTPSIETDLITVSNYTAQSGGSGNLMIMARAQYFLRSNDNPEETTLRLKIGGTLKAAGVLRTATNAAVENDHEGAIVLIHHEPAFAGPADIVVTHQRTASDAPGCPSSIAPPRRADHGCRYRGHRSP